VLASFTSEFLTKEAFEKFRADVEDKYGDNFWKQVEIIETPIINNHNDEILKLQEAEVSFKLKNGNDTLLIPLKTFYLQKEGWAFVGSDIRIISPKQEAENENFEEGEDDDPEAVTNKTQFKPDPKKEIKGFDTEFENIEDDPEDLMTR
jgi:hypothetical protein